MGESNNRRRGPYWIRWVGEDATASCLRARDILNDIVLDVVRGGRRDEIVEKAQQAIAEIDEAKDDYLSQLIHGADLERLWEWLQNDEIARGYLEGKLKSNGSNCG